MSATVRLFEVSLRDGLQNEPVVVSTQDKLAVAHQLVEAGFKDIEVTSFVRPRWVPQLADATDLVRQLPYAPDVRYWALVPNAIGLDRALEAGLDHIATFLSSSETHNKKNVNRTISESLRALGSVIERAVAEDVRVRSYISTAFGCPFEGPVAPERVVELASALLDAGATEIALGDTTGMANPAQVKSLLRRLVAAGVPLERIGVHFHDTRGTAVVNAYAAWQEGIRMFDGAVSGVGGCPYAPGAAGNAATQDLIHMFHEMGVSTGVDLDRACDVGVLLESVLGRELPGRYHQYWRAQQERRQSRSA